MIPNLRYYILCWTAYMEKQKGANRASLQQCKKTDTSTLQNKR